MQRRTLLALLGTGTTSLTGCVTSLGDVDNSNPSDASPENCPTSQNIGVEWPEELDSSTVESFVETYEQVYYKEKIVEYAPETSLDSYELSGKVVNGPTEVEEGWEMKYRGGGPVYRPILLMGATPKEAPSETEVIPLEEIDKEPLVETLQNAAESGNAELAVETPREEIEDYVELFESLSEDIELSGRGDSSTLYVDVDGTTVELSVHASDFHGDYDWEAWYFVNEQVVRRTTDEDTEPQNGELLECRE